MTLKVLQRIEGSEDMSRSNEGKGAKNRLIEVVIREVEAHRRGKHSAECMGEILIAVRKYQDEKKS